MGDLSIAHRMWLDLFVIIFLFVAVSISHQSGELIRKIDSKDDFIDPNDWSHNGHQFSSNGEVSGTPYDREVFQLERQCSPPGKTEKSLEKTVLEYVTLRRFVNLLLRRAKFEDVAGNIVPLESVSRLQDDKLVMSFVVFAKPKEIQSLLDFGQKKTSPYPRKIDEILTNLTSTPELDLKYRKCQPYFQSWIKEFGSVWQRMVTGIDFMVVVYMMTVCYIVWSVKLVLTRGSSWKRVLSCFLVPSIIWEFSKRLEEEKLRQYSDQLRLGKIPDHCLGLENNGDRWWPAIFGGNAKEECHEHHMAQMGHSVLKVSIFKIALVHLEQLLGLLVNLIKDLTASSPGDGWFTNLVMRNVAWLCITVTVIAVTIFYISQRQVVPRWRPRMAGGGSRVQPLEEEQRAPEEEEEEEAVVVVKPKAPERRRRRGPLDQTDGGGGAPPALAVEDVGRRLASCCCCGRVACPPSAPTEEEEEEEEEEKEKGEEKEGEKEEEWEEGSAPSRKALES